MYDFEEIKKKALKSTIDKLVKPLLKSILFYTPLVIISVITFINNQYFGIIAILLLFLSLSIWCKSVLKPMVDKSWDKDKHNK